jgi:uncharacterized protein (DUF1330 family)
MSALFIVFVEKAADESEMDAYRKLALPSLQGRDVKFLTRPGVELHTLEGAEVETVVTIKFASVQDAKDWYHSSAYQQAVKHRHGTARSRAVIVETLD